MYEAHIAVVKVLRSVFEEVKHYKIFTSGMKPIFDKALPGYTVRIGIKGDRYSVSVWGNGIPYEDCVCLIWSGYNNSKTQTWQEGFKRALEVADRSDYAERARLEEGLYSDLAKLHLEVEERIRAAHILIETLPIPMSATVRSDQAHWSSPSSTLADRFPLLFRTRAYLREPKA